jgi:hypothetical protein
MSTRDERNQWLAEVRRLLAEAKMAHSLSDDESELVLLDLELDREQHRLDQLAHTDPIGFAWFGHDDDWINKRLRAADGST